MCVTPPPENDLQQIKTNDEPILFRSSVQRSATFEGSPPSQSKIHRSETVPAASVASSLATIGSNIKLNFRYSYFYFKNLIIVE